jgi:hypothetical protein
MMPTSARRRDGIGLAPQTQQLPCAMRSDAIEFDIFIAMNSEESINLREWRPPATARHCGQLFTCCRTGRWTPGYGRDRKLVDDTTIDCWVAALPKAEPLHVVSLLGPKKPTYRSSFTIVFGRRTETRVPTGNVEADLKHQAPVGGRYAQSALDECAVDDELRRHVRRRVCPS